MTPHQIVAAFAKILEREEQAETDRRNLLRRCGWEYTSDTPGSVWMMRKYIAEGTVYCSVGTAEDVTVAEAEKAIQ